MGKNNRAAKDSYEYKPLHGRFIAAISQFTDFHLLLGYFFCHCCYGCCSAPEQSASHLPLLPLPLYPPALARSNHRRRK